nr:hypothetical protein [Buzura suppressaria nucleopolyhedrovirus]
MTRSIAYIKRSDVRFSPQSLNCLLALTYYNMNNEINFNQLYVCEIVRCVRIINFSSDTQYKCVECAQSEPVMIDIIFKHKLRPIQTIQMTDMESYTCCRCNKPTRTISNVSDCKDCFEFCNDVYKRKIDTGCVMLYTDST